MSGSNIPLTPCVSSNVAAWGHRDDTLAIQFKSGGIYHYAGVPASMAEAFADPEVSIGSLVSGIRKQFEGVLQKPAVDDE